MNSQFEINVVQSLTNERLRLILYPTEKCNFSCLYCYEDHTQPRMSDDVVHSIKLFLTKRITTLKLLELEWFGGEPMLAKDIIVDVTSYAKKICEEHSVRFVSYITTNGYLLDKESFSLLVSLGVTSFQITLDGDKNFHNKNRLMKSNQCGTFDTIWNNLLSYRDIVGDFTVVIRCHLYEDNIHSIESLLQKIQYNFLCDKRFVVHLKEVSPLGGPNDNKINFLSREEKRKLVVKLKSDFSTLRYLDIVEDYICYAAKPNCIAIRPNGNIIKCTVAMDHDLNNVGKLGNDGTLFIDENKFFKWSEGFNTLDKAKLDCPFYKAILI